MRQSYMILPTNKKFGLFFTLIFVILSVYFYVNSYINLAYICILSSIIFFLIVIIKADILLPLNKIWMCIGVLLGMIISPIVLGIIFFGIFTPIGLLIRLFGRDELCLKIKKKSSHWKSKDELTKTNSFKYQF